MLKHPLVARFKDEQHLLLSAPKASRSLGAMTKRCVPDPIKPEMAAHHLNPAFTSLHNLTAVAEF